MAHISFLAYKFSSLTDDHITVGLLYSSDNERVKAFISEERLKILKKLVSSNMYSHFLRYVNSLQENGITFLDLNHESKYQNGYIKITSPGPAACDEATAKMIFELKIDTNYLNDGN